jgi:hypothetical protein
LPVQLQAAEAVFAGNALGLRPVIALDGQGIRQGDPAELS